MIGEKGLLLRGSFLNNIKSKTSDQKTEWKEGWLVKNDWTQSKDTKNKATDNLFCKNFPQENWDSKNGIFRIARDIFEVL